MATAATTADTKKNPSAVVPQTKQTDYFGAVISYLGVPDTPANRNFLQGWAMVEGTKAKWNPLATTINAPGATDFNSVHVKNYPNAAEGAAATAQTIKQYPNIVKALQTGEPVVGGITAGITHDFGVWVSGSQGEGTAPWEAKAVQYTRAVWNSAQGDPSGKGAYSGFGFGNYPSEGGITGALSAPGNLLVGGADTVKNDVLSVLGLTGLAKDALYIAILVGGGIILLTGFVLIGADIGLAVFARMKAPQKASVITRNLPANRRAQSSYDNRSYRSSREGINPNEGRRSVDTGIGRRRKSKPGEPGSTKLAKGDSIPY